MATPTEIIADARSYAGALVTASEAALEEATSALGRIGYRTFQPGTVPLPAAPPTGLSLTLPTLTGVTVEPTTAPSAELNFQDISGIELGSAPVFATAAPTIAMPNRPSELAAFTASLPSVDLSAAFPVAPSLIMPEAPTVDARTAPTAPTTVLPAFEAIAPTGLPQAPSDLDRTFSAAYHEVAPEFITMINGHVDAEMTKLNPQYHAQMAAIERQLTTYLAGGTGLKAEVEGAIYNRARERTDADAARARDAAYAEAASRGFTLPSGALMGAVARARQEAANNNAKTSADIAIAQAEMEQKNLQFAVTTSVGLRATMVNATLAYMQNLGQLNGQALDYAKSTLGAIVEAYNIAARVFAAELDAYKAEAQVFEVRMRAALAGIEIYKAEIDALRALTQVDQTRVDIYKARIDVLTAASNMYRAQMEAVLSKASLQKLKIDVFNAQVQAHNALVAAKNAEWQGYTAAINGEGAKVQLYNAQAQVHNVQVQGYRATIDAQSEVVRAQAITNDARAKGFAAAWDAYKATVQAKGEVARTELENQRQTIVAFQAQASAAVANAQVQNEYYKSTAQVGIENAKMWLTGAVESANSAHNYASTLAKIHTANATIHGNLAGAAMAGMNSLVASTETN